MTVVICRALASTFLLLLVAGAAAPPTKQQRAVHLRSVVLAAMEHSYEHDGGWPEKIASGLVYIKPTKIEDTERGFEQSWVTVVAHEPIESHPDGVWVGYADGHLEFVISPAALADCKAQVQIVNEAIAKYGAVFEAEPTTKPAPAKPTGELKLKLLDPDGHPVAGATVGVFGNWGDRFSKRNRSGFVGKNDVECQGLVSDVNGEVTLPAARVFVPPFRFGNDESAPLYIIHEKLNLAASHEVQRTRFNEPAPLEIRLQVACNVRGEVTCVGLPGRDVKYAGFYTFRPGRFRQRSVDGEFIGDTFNFLLPPGDHVLIADALDTYKAVRCIRIAPGEKERTLYLDAPPTEIAQLVGQPAPELRKIKGWKNGGPVKLADLRGQVVLLDFWGHWCGPCVSSMPALMKLHDEFKDRGLVIIALHDDSAESIADMDAKLQGPRKEYWNGRELPFLVALDGGGPTRIRHSTRKADGATTAAYGINSFPTSLLVGRDGKVIEEIHPTQPSARNAISKALGNSKSAAK
jgi:thiol-disulfide isomerase/thioredoxin